MFQTKNFLINWITYSTSVSIQRNSFKERTDEAGFVSSSARGWWLDEHVVARGRAPSVVTWGTGPVGRGVSIGPGPVEPVCLILCPAAETLLKVTRRRVATWRNQNNSQARVFGTFQNLTRALTMCVIVCMRGWF